jgi:hypothetical protein
MSALEGVLEGVLEGIRTPNLLIRRQPGLDLIRRQPGLDRRSEEAYV